MSIINLDIIIDTNSLWNLLNDSVRRRVRFFRFFHTNFFFLIRHTVEQHKNRNILNIQRRLLLHILRLSMHDKCINVKYVKTTTTT